MWGGASGNMGKMSSLNIGNFPIFKGDIFPTGNIGKYEQTAPDPSEAVQNF